MDHAPPPPPISLYAHVPFCASECSYCYYVKAVGRDASAREAYVAALGEELRTRWEPFVGRRVSSVYIGGGTPSILGRVEIESLARHLCVAADLRDVAEVTFEMNPSVSSRGQLELLRGLGINRVSFGLQTVDDGALRNLARGVPGRGTVPTLRRNVAWAREAGIPNLNVDLLLGIPGETDASVLAGVALVVEEEIPHVSLYPLQVGPGTNLFARLMLGQDSVPPEGERQSRYANAIEVLEAAGYQRSGIAHWVRHPTFQCKHHQEVWDAQDLLGIGASAQSWEGGRFRRNADSIEDYIRGTHRPSVELVLSQGDQVRRWALMQLTRKLGFSNGRFVERWGADAWAFLDPELDHLARHGLVERAGDGVVVPLAARSRTRELVSQLRFDHADYIGRGAHLR